MAKSIAFIGSGNMGCPMAENLMNAGEAVKVFDVSETNVNCKAMKYEEWSSYHRFLLNWK